MTQENLLSKSLEYDKGYDAITQRRGAVYGHPYDNFLRTAKLWSVVLGVEVTPLQVAQCMRLVKEARLIETPDHIDSLIDISGYSRTQAMVLDRLEQEDGDEATRKLR